MGGNLGACEHTKTNIPHEKKSRELGYSSSKASCPTWRRRLRIMWADVRKFRGLFREGGRKKEGNGGMCVQSFKPGV